MKQSAIKNLNVPVFCYKKDFSTSPDKHRDEMRIKKNIREFVADKSIPGEG